MRTRKTTTKKNRANRKRNPAQMLHSCAFVQVLSAAVHVTSARTRAVRTVLVQFNFHVLWFSCKLCEFIKMRFALHTVGPGFFPHILKRFQCIQWHRHGNNSNNNKQI